METPVVNGRNIWAVENPAVFRELHLRLSTRVEAERPCLVLTSGNPSLAVQLLMDRLMRAAVPPTLYYSGDNDARGLELLRFWQARYPGRVEAWGMACGSGLAPVEVTPATMWQEDLIDHLWRAICA